MWLDDYQEFRSLNSIVKKFIINLTNLRGKWIKLSSLGINKYLVRISNTYYFEKRYS